MNINLFKKLNLNRILIITGGVALIFIVVFLFWFNHEIIIGGVVSNGKSASPISGLQCDNANRRPVTIMLASDPETRPLSAIGQADMVFEMPVTPNGVTRMMAVFQCEDPSEIGSIRSAREDFIPLAAGFNSIYVHWGGEHGALQNLDNHVVDNVDGLKYEGATFYRKKGIPPPHNGFSDLGKIFDKVKELGYDLSLNFPGYPHLKNIPGRNLSNFADRIDVGYPSPFDVVWNYNQDSKTYLRTRNNTSEIDKNTDQQVSVSVVILMFTKSNFLRDQYITVQTQGQGSCQVYQNGSVASCSWKKDLGSISGKLYFYDDKGQEIKFVPGKIWVEIVTNS